MKTDVFKISLIALGFLLFSDSNFAQKPDQCLGLITGLKGDVYISKDGNGEFSKTRWGAQLYEGYRVKTSAMAEAIIAFSNGNIIKLGPDSNITISDNNSSETRDQPGIEKVSSASFINLNYLSPGKEYEKETGALAGLRSKGSSKNIELIYPYNSLIKENRPSFTWDPLKEYDTYIISLYDSKGLVWSRESKDTVLIFPEDETGLARGASYFWNVNGEELISSDKSENAVFTILSSEKLKEETDTEELIKRTFGNNQDSSNLHFILGTYYFNQGLLQDALSEYQAISKIYSNSSYAHRLISSVFNQMGKKDKAIEELERALALSENKEY